MEEKNFICTACPMGCKLIVRMEGDEVVKILGHRCRKGETYGRQEAVAPQRMLASTVKISNGIHPLLPVYTKGSIPKRKIFEVLEMIRAIEVTAPVKAEDVIIENVIGTGVNVIASRDMPAKK
jgi:CxxC motif-containing protein